MLNCRSLHLQCVFASTIALTACCFPSAGEAPPLAIVTYNAATHIFRLDGGDVSYILGLTGVGEVQSIYWGARLSASDAPRPAHPVSWPFEITDAPQEFSGWGGGLLTEPSLKITFPDGNRDLVLHYQSHSIHGNELRLTLRDIQRDIFVTLLYSIDPATGILARSAQIENRTAARVMVEQAESGSWNLPPDTRYSLRYLSGRWGGEFQMQTHTIDAAKTVLESRRGMTGHQYSPWFAITRGPEVSERDGNVWFGGLAWSGSWRIIVEQDPARQVHITGGFNPFDFGYPLEPGQKLETPIFYGGHTTHGLGEASRLMHRFELAGILPQRPNPRPRPVLYNSWEATEFSVDEVGQEQLAEKAARIGVERFVMDDGWFGERKDDHAGLGDWYVNAHKFPHGLSPLIEKVHSLNMDFGLWVEPEMVNLNSDLYRKHPDWVISFIGRPRTTARSQLILNLARPDVRQYIFSFLDKLLNENQIAFFKWDANRNWSEPGSPESQPDEEKKLYVDYVNGYYAILRDIRAKHPKVEIESCSGGGGRIDLGVMKLVDEVWTSDNTDPFDRLSIQNGFSYAYTPGVMMAWVTDSPNWYNRRATSLSYRFLSSMQGGLGIGANLNKWTGEDFATAKQMVTAYKAIRETVQHGDLYRLSSPADNSLSATESVSVNKNSAVLFLFLHSQQMRYPAQHIFLEGLDRGATYSIKPIAGKLTDDTPSEASGAYWMEHGVDPQLSGDYDAAAFTLEKR